MDKELYNLIKRVNNDGIIFTKPSRINNILSKKYKKYTVLYNYRDKEVAIVNKKKLKDLLKNNIL